MAVQIEQNQEVNINNDKSDGSIRLLLITALRNMPYWLVIMVLGVGYYNEHLIHAYETICKLKA